MKSKLWSVFTGSSRDACRAMATRFDSRFVYSSSNNGSMAARAVISPCSRDRTTQGSAARASGMWRPTKRLERLSVKEGIGHPMVFPQGNTIAGPPDNVDSALSVLPLKRWELSLGKGNQDGLYKVIPGDARPWKGKWDCCEKKFGRHINREKEAT